MASPSKSRSSSHKPLLAAALENLMVREGLRDRLELAQFLGVPPTTVYRWFSGGGPNIDKLETLLDKIGGDLARAFPEGLLPSAPESEQPQGAATAPEQALELLHRGLIIGPRGDVQLVGTTESAPRTNLAALLANHPLWQHCSGPLSLLAVDGGDLAPACPKGSHLVARFPCAPDQVPSGSIVIIRDREADTLHAGRLNRISHSNLIQALPLSGNNGPPVRTWKKSEAEIRLVVLASIALTPG